MSLLKFFFVYVEHILFKDLKKKVSVREQSESPSNTILVRGENQLWKRNFLLIFYFVNNFYEHVSQWFQEFDSD